MRFRAIIADDLLLLRQGVRAVLETLPDIEVVGEADDYDSLMRLVELERPDLVVSDIRMPPSHSNEGVVAARKVRAAFPDTRVIVLSQYLDADYVLELFEDGTEGLGYLLKEHVADRRQLSAAIEAVCSSGSSIDPAVVGVLVSARTRRPSPIDQLTDRERDVLALIAEGLRNSAIAEGLAMGEKSVEKHSNSIFAKLGLNASDETNPRVRSVLMWLAEN